MNMRSDMILDLAKRSNAISILHKTSAKDRYWSQSVASAPKVRW